MVKKVPERSKIRKNNLEAASRSPAAPRMLGVRIAGLPVSTTLASWPQLRRQFPWWRTIPSMHFEPASVRTEETAAGTP